MKRLLFIAGLCVPTFGAACSPAPVMRPRADPTATVDDWKRSAMWLHATDKSPSGHGPECKHVRAVLDGEGSCKGALCQYPAELAAEWLDKCSKLEADGVEKIADLQAGLSEEAERRPSECFKQFKRFRDDGCEKEHCEDDAQTWATQCGETEGTPLIVHMLAKIVDRHIGSEKPIQLDARSCDSLDEQVVEGAACKTEKECKAAWKVVGTQKKRCADPNELPEIADAMRELSIAAGAVRDIDETIEVSDEPALLEKDDLPLVLADGTGAVFAVCHQRVTDLEAYLSARASCDGGFVYLARMFDKDREIRMGEIPIREGWDVLDLFPELAVVGEKERLEEQQAKSLAKALDAAISEAELGKLVAAIEDHEAWIFRSKRVRKELAKRDEALTPLFGAAAAAKVTAGKLTSSARKRALAARAKDFVFADLSREGTVDSSTPTAATWLETEDLLPKSTAAYRAAIKPLRKKSRFDKPPRSSDVERALEQAEAAAVACGKTQAAESNARVLLVRCVFDECDDQEIQDQIDNRDNAIVNTKVHLHNLLAAVSSVESGQLVTIADDADCELPTL